jgi:hypothetical protein
VQCKRKPIADWPSGALTLARKADSELTQVAVDFNTAWKIISQAQATAR